MSQTVFHASDLHFGAHYEDQLIAFRREVQSAKPSLVVLSGDITHEGRKIQFEQAANFIESLDAPVFIVPGNHDAPVYDIFARVVSPYRRFGHLPGLHGSAQVGQVSLVHLKTAHAIQPRPDWSKGHVSTSDWRAAMLQMDKFVPRDSTPMWRILVGHHPLIDEPGAPVDGAVSNGIAWSVRSKEAGIDMILSGHTHRHAVWRTDQTLPIMATAATLSNPRLRGQPHGFNRYEINGSQLESIALTYDSGNWIKAPPQTFQK